MAVVHSDGQYPPEHVFQLIKPLLDGKAQAVSGARIAGDPFGGGMPLWRYLGNRVLTWMEDFLIGHTMSEWHSGFRAYDIHALKRIPFNQCENGYQWTTDILLLLLTNNNKIAEITIPTHYGEDSTSPSVYRTFAYAFHTMKLAFIFFLNRIHLVSNKKYTKKAWKRA